MSTRALDQLAVGETATVDSVEGDGAVAIRLQEMGFTAGTKVALVKTAPLGDPLEFTLRGFHISLRRAEAARVRVA
ncbi:MAG: ferrous iron transport protein A [Deltaproteobacteria bacterium]|nr:ferrous iron transport protein A [Deltaproteobacteria bacterium]MBK8235825.1 ferrous iron transport protein A [Deltaproteobacteria bacterium]MBK8713454.1 ferrous iron transport protein A [Deltaproteobacteria bacterium]MBP7288079.1 ferrous iron transport protein A [Nannocystaceae bacterium]